jgi:hypothetical protein
VLRFQLATTATLDIVKRFAKRAIPPPLDKGVEPLEAD